MSERERAKAQAQKLAKAAPPLTEAEVDKINSEFRAFIFRKSKTRELWTTCCGRHEIVPEQNYSDALHRIMEAEHHREFEYVPSGWGPGRHSHKRHGDLFMHGCPYCGQTAYVKELGRTGKRDNLAEYGKVAIIRWYRNALWVRAFFVKKLYSDKGQLTNKPHLTLNKVYRFKPGEAMCAVRSWASCEIEYIEKLASKPKKLPLPIYEPFSHDSSDYSFYIILGHEDVKKSPFKYCEYERFENDYGSPMRFLTVCCIFPRQVEMLMKAGMEIAVRDLVMGRKWNAAAFKWEEENPLTSFDLDRTEMKTYLETEKNLDALAQYKQFRRAGIRCEIKDVEVMLRDYNLGGKVKKVLKRLKEWKIEPATWLKYMKTNIETKNKRRKKSHFNEYQMTNYWLDYLDAAVTLGYDLENPLVRMPKNLVAKHDEATGVVNAILAAEQEKKDAAEAKKQKAEIAKRVPKYEFSLGDYCIKVPMSAAEVIAEGKALEHCVGGYADRHVKGVLSVLFLRLAAEPDKPLVTIEMGGNTLRQIHGYKNDIGKDVKPMEEYAEFLDAWLGWLKKGSKRDKDGNPILPKSSKSKDKLAQAS